jgi:hypothetical protein
MSKQLSSHVFYLGILACFWQAIGFAQTPTPSDTDQQIVGTWEWSLDVGPANGKASMVVAVVDGKLVGEVTAPDGHVLKAEDLCVEKDRVSFSISRDMGLLQMSMSYAGKLDGDEMTGTFNMKGGPMRKNGKWHAKRVKSK